MHGGSGLVCKRKGGVLCLRGCRVPVCKVQEERGLVYMWNEENGMVCKG